LPIFDQILSLQISLVIKPSDLCELNDTGGGKGDQQRIKVFLVMIIINIKHERDCLLSMSFLLEVSLTALFAFSFETGLYTFDLQSFPLRKQKKAEPLLALPLSIGIRF
jgi:hypothetical protein